MKPLRSCLPKHLLLHPEFRWVPSANQTVEHLKGVFARERERLRYAHLQVVPTVARPKEKEGKQ